MRLFIIAFGIVFWSSCGPQDKVTKYADTMCRCTEAYYDILMKVRANEPTTATEAQSPQLYKLLDEMDKTHKEMDQCVGITRQTFGKNPGQAFDDAFKKQCPDAADIYFQLKAKQRIQ